MCNNNKNDGGTQNIDIAELINKKTNFNIQIPKSKPLDVPLMTGKNQDNVGEKVKIVGWMERSHF